MKNIRIGSRLQVLAFGLLAGTSLSPVPTFAQTGAENAGPEIIVTSARKRDESVLDTPIAISAFTGEDLAQRGVATFTDLASQTPGFNLNAAYSGRADRSYAQLIIRGFTSSSPETSTASMFIDGVPVSSSTALSSINNPARVEVLKGPQAAYFGRQTFAGAINVVNREPGDRLAGKVTAMLGTRENHEIYGEIEAPIIQDVLGLRLTAGKWAKEGGYRNTFNNTTLGDQSNQNYSAFVTFTPASNFKVRAFGMYSRDEDGASPTGLIASRDYRGTDGNLVFVGQSNCILPGYTSTVEGQGQPSPRPFFCGIAPKLAQGPSVNNDVDSITRDFLGNAWAGLDEYGLARNFYHGHVNVDYEVGETGLTISSLTGFNRETMSTLLDSDNRGSITMPNARAGRSYYDYVYLSQAKRRDFSQELRLSYDQGPLQATLGASYLNAWSMTAGGGGQLPAARVFRNGKTQAKTFGLFGAASYRFNNGITVSAEGRYQGDTLSAYAAERPTVVSNPAIIPVGTYPEGSLLLKKTFKNFMPRVIVQYDIPGSDLMTYASWSKGVNPGRFNTQFLTASERVIDIALASGVGVAVKPEKVTNYEIGLKGSLFDRALTFSSSLYYAQWRDQINTIALADYDAPSDRTILIAATANAGSVDLWGLELESSWRVNHMITLQAGGAITNTKILDYSYPLTSQLTGSFDFRGNEMPNTSKYSAVAGIRLEDSLSANSDSTWFLRADYSFKSGVWSNAGNIVRTPDRSLVNMRGGISFGHARVEAFMTNVFDNKQYISISDTYQTDPNVTYAFNDALAVGLPERRTAGVKFSFEF